MFRRPGRKALIYILFILCFQIVLSYTLVYEWTVARLKSELDRYAQRVEQDISFRNGKWDLTKYLADPLTPHPTGSSGFTRPLYITSADGFVIERSNPVSGYLDVSDMKHLLQFQNVRTLTAVTNEKWRVLSKPVMSNGSIVGVITTSKYNPDENNLPDLDARLDSTINSLMSLIKVDSLNGQIDVSRVDIRNVNYDFSFEIVNKFNKTLINNGRTPSFIDTSYIIDEINSKPYSIISDRRTAEPFLIHRKVILAGNQQEGLVVTADSMKNIFSILNSYLLISTLTTLIVIIPLGFYTVNALKKNATDAEPTVKSISMDRKKSVLSVDNKSVQIPYASNQYYLLDALLSNPGKRWENDELLEKLGEEESGNSRSVYDAMLAINRKASFRLIEYSDRTYRINPRFVNQVQKQ